MAKAKHFNSLSDPLPDLPNYDPEPADGVRVGESPVPGLTLKRILRGHKNYINRIAWSSEGRYVASPSQDTTIRIWDVVTGECKAVLHGHNSDVISVAWSPDGQKLASVSWDKSVRFWDAKSGELISEHVSTEHLGLGLSWSPDSCIIAISSYGRAIQLLDADRKQFVGELVQDNAIYDIVWSPSGKLLASGSENTVSIWDIETKQVLWSENEHSKSVLSIAWSPDEQIVVSGAQDNTIGVWDLKKGKLINKLEEHTSEVYSIAFSADGRLLVSKSLDNTVRFWRCRDWEVLGILQEEVKGTNLSGLAFHSTKPNLLATLGELDTIIRIWQIDEDILLNKTQTNSIRYTTAKLVLVGDSGVGKTGLGWRLAHGEFKEHASTHGQQFWVVDDLCTTRADGTECEAVLWDLAGQHIYRPIHAIFLDDVDASMVLFDPTNRQDPLKGAEFWLEQLAHKEQLPPSVLVGARLDRGASVLSQEDLSQFCQQYGISGGYVGTSAKEGLGLEELLEILKRQIPWDQMTTTVTTVTFKRVKEYVLGLKEKPDRKGVLVNPEELRRQLQVSDTEWDFSDAEMMTAVGHLSNHGYVTILRSSSGQQHILLTPELLVDLASSIVLQADKHPRELGALNETELLQGRYPLPELSDLEPEEQQILLDAAVARFLEHNICFRETLGTDTLLIFPGLIKQKRPLQDEVEAVDDISYIVRGRVENIYPALVVLLGFTRTFTRVNQWQRQAQYEMGGGNICGFRLIEDVEGEIELVLYYSTSMPDYGRQKFQGLFEEFLYQRDVEVTAFPPVVCPKGHLQERSAVIKRRREDKSFLFCAECGDKIDLPDADKQPTVNAPEASWIQREEALVRLRSTYETHLTRIKGFRRDRAAPRCYISHLPAQAGWVGQLTGDLRDAGVHVITDRGDIKDDDFILIADTPAYQRSFKNKTEPIAADADLVRNRWKQGKKSTIVHLLFESEEKHPTSSSIQSGDFRRDSHYAVSLFDLVLTLYAIPHNHQAFEPLREALYQRWVETVFAIDEKIEREEEHRKKDTPRIFISYAHKDEAFKDELIVMLAGMQRRGVIDAWQDRLIEAGDEWYQAIQDAMNACDIALLLVSKNFLASRFIQDEEVPRLLNRRQDEGMRVIPIIIRPCTWNSEPVLKDLQALPEDGKAVITFPEKTGERDQVWTDIAEAIERHVQKLRSDI